MLAAAAWAAAACDTDTTRAAYVLGPDDVIAVHAVEGEEIGDKPFRIDISGYVRMPLVGRMQASGLTVEQFENSIAGRLKVYIKEPEVSVTVVEFRSQPVSVLGSIRNPGVHQLQGRKTLVEILSLAGGISDDAGYGVKIARRLEWGRIPLPSNAADPTGGFWVAQVSLKEIMEARNPSENILICPHDVISVPRAEMVYVIGQVPRAGGYVLRERETLSVLQALALAGGLGRVASPQKARILRPEAGGGSRAEIPVNLKKIMEGEAGDMPLLPEDILFIPSSAPKRAIGRVAEAAIQVTTGLIIFRR
jgi:polysaccharide export outer membrane protein